MTVAKAGFNTASGRYCCNILIDEVHRYVSVSIPQAVGTVATHACGITIVDYNSVFQYRKR